MAKRVNREAVAAGKVTRNGAYIREDGQYRKYGKRWTQCREIVLRRDDCTCGYCGRSVYDTEGLVMEVDHILPFALGGGEYDYDNVVASCFDCNRTFGKRRKPAHIEMAVLRLVMARNRA
jgi:5-methylcytosine-specific restriction endonuclease McrA